MHPLSLSKFATIIVKAPTRSAFELALARQRAAAEALGGYVAAVIPWPSPGCEEPWRALLSLVRP